MGNKIITEKDFWICAGGTTPAPLQTTQLTTKKESGHKYITVADTATSSWIDFGCRKLMWIMAILAAVVVVVVVATGGAALGALIAAGAIAGAAGAAFGAVVGALICGQKAAAARKWLNSKPDMIIQGRRAISGDNKMKCMLFGEEIIFAPHIKNWWQAIALGASNYIGGIMEGMMYGAAIGAAGGVISGGPAVLGQFGVSNVAANWLATWGGWGLGLRGVVTAQSVLGAYGNTGEVTTDDVVSKGIFGMETGTLHSAQIIALSAEGIKEVADEFAAEMRHRPSCADLFEILTWALRTGDKDKLSDVNTYNIIALRPQMKKRDGRPDSLDRDYSGGAVAGLNDAVFVAASDFLLRLVKAFKDATGRLPSLTDFCDLLVDGLRQCDELLLDDIFPAQITSVKPEVLKQKKITPRVGDIVAIPARNGDYFFAVVLAKNAFGTAYGLFEGTSRLKPVSKDSHPAVNPRPVYSADDLIESGRWKIIGHDEGLLSLFPEEPEIYHRQRADRPNPQLGPYGAGETASGKLRPLTREEAEEIGLLGDEYRQSYLPETLENYLNAKLK
jgi:hypothetical protein